VIGSARLRRTRRGLWTGRRHLLGAAAVLVAAALWVRLGPIPADLFDDRGATSTLVVDRHGVPLYEALSGEGTRSVPLTADALPRWLVAATIAAEDRRFWRHPGVDPIAIARALRDAMAGQPAPGGASTISQQVAKLLLARRDPARRRTLAAKIEEAVLALRLEHRLDKREILARYLNMAAYGGQVVGAERAGRAYFNRSAAMLTPAQAAFLAGLPQRPSGYNPYRRLEPARVRQSEVLRRMEASGALPPELAREARRERLEFVRPASAFAAPHFVEMVLADAGDVRPLRIETTLDSRLQGDVAGIIRSHRAMLTRHGAANVAVVVLANATGEWLAWEGSGDYADAAGGGAINGPITPRQPGSALKPFTYALAFEDGVDPASVLPDVPSSFPTADPGVLYSPRNYDGRYRGPLLARRALAGSENVPAVALASQLGVPRLVRFLHRAGFTTLDRAPSYYGLGVTLGNAEVRLDEMVAAYAAFARGGEWIAPTAVRAIASARARHTLVSPRAAFWVTDILSDPEAREYIFGRGGSLDLPFPAAVKTGTSQAYHDNWTIGYTRDVTVGVWVGNFDRTPLRNSSGVTGAAPIFHAVMLAAVGRAGSADIGAPRARPDPAANVAEREVCALSGLGANPWCPSRRLEWLPAGDSRLPCSWHHLTDDGPAVYWPPEYRQWASAHGRLDAVRRASGPSVSQVRQAAATRRPALAIANPPAGAVYSIDPTLRREFQTLSLRASAESRGRLEWSVDGRSLGSAASDGSMAWPLEPGRHVIAARDRRGRVAEAWITVR
jgi:penicillin-binding protein 1C